MIITNYKNFMILNEYSFYDDFVKNKIRNVEYYLDEIKKNNHTENDVVQLFHWACLENIGDLAYELSKILSDKKLRDYASSIINLEHKYFKKILNENKKIIISGLNHNNFIEKLINSDNVENFKLFSNEIELTQKLLMWSCYYESYNIFKYLISKGLNPERMEKNSPWTYHKINCLDEACERNKSYKIIDALVNDLKLHITYRHMYDTIDNDNFKAFEILLKSNKIIDDYAYSHMNTHSNKHKITLMDVVNILKSKNKINYIKKLLNDNSRINEAYHEIQMLPKNIAYKNKNVFGEPDVFGPYKEVLKKDFLDIAYLIINLYKGAENFFNTIFITDGHEKYWIKKMKENPNIIEKLEGLSDEFKSKYEYQKMLLELDEKNIQKIIDSGVINPKILKEYDYLDEVIKLTSDKFNL